jgi:pimeloyl-ACP methyl ester carboxylesterase
MGLKEQFIRSVSKIAPGITSRWAERIFLTPTRSHATPVELATLAQGTLSKLAVDGRILQAWSWGPATGEAPTLLLLHGWGGRAGQWHPFVKPLLEAGYRVVAFDAPGHGLSEGEEVSMIDFTRALEAFAAREGEIAGVLGHSMGGATAAYAALRGTAFPKVVAIGAPSDLEQVSFRFAESMGLDEGIRKRMRRRIEQRYGVEWEDLCLTRRRREMTSPLLVVHDEKDKEVPYWHAEQLAGAWPGARLLPTSGLGHRRVLRDTRVIAEVVKFLKGSETQDEGYARSAG